MVKFELQISGLGKVDVECNMYEFFGTWIKFYSYVNNQKSTVAIFSAYKVLSITRVSA